MKSNWTVSTDFKAIFVTIVANITYEDMRKYTKL